ncbi:hypothetical protein V2J09_005932 [Rumex salicifolius]
MTFTRLCVNTDVQFTIGRKIIILDEHMYEKSTMFGLMTSLWTVGLVGNLAMILILALTVSSATESAPSSGEWKKSHLNPQGHKPYLAENGGITITYKSEESSEEQVTPAMINNEANTLTMAWWRMSYIFPHLILASII